MPVFRRTITLLLLTIITLSLVPPTIRAQDEPVTLYDTSYNDEPLGLVALDPQVGAYVLTIQNLFVGLTNFDPDTGEVIPRLAVSWTVSDDARTWTFTLRDNVPWVRWDPVAREADIFRMVNAHDVVYGIQRMCDPRVGALYVDVIDEVIAGCDELAARVPNEITDDDLAMVGVRALDDTTVEFTLQYPARQFLSLVSVVYLITPVPREVVEQYGDDWTLPEHFVSSGPFVLDEWRDGRAWTMVTNPHLPADLRDPGNVERVVMTVAGDGMAAFALYEFDQADLSWVINLRQDEIINDPVWSQEIVRSYYPTSRYYAFANDKPPFDNVHVRRAFSAALDRDAWCADIWPYSCVPLIHFTPPGVFGAPPIDEVGVGYDPDYAREQLALAGYPGCEGFPEIIVATWGGAAGVFTWLGEHLEAVLGCGLGLWHIEEMSGDDLAGRIRWDAPIEFRPHMWVGGWGADYPDAHNLLGDFLHCEVHHPVNRPCSPVDDLIDQAAIEVDPLVRAALYRDIEERLFGPEGEVPFIPVHGLVGLDLVKPWVISTPDFAFGGKRYDWYSIDQEAQLAARGE